MRHYFFILISTFLSNCFFSQNQVFHIKFEDENPFIINDGKLESADLKCLSCQDLVPFGKFKPFYPFKKEELKRFYEIAFNSDVKQRTNPNSMLSFVLNSNLDATKAEALLLEIPGVQYVKKAPKLALPTPPDFQNFQSYLYNGDEGMNIDSFNMFYPVFGTGVKVMDVEYSFNPSHVDLPNIQIIGNTPQDPGFGTNHGTAVFGQIASISNGFGTVGASPNVNLFFAGAYYDNTYLLEDALAQGLGVLNAGDILLIEQQTFVTVPNDPLTTYYGPVEWYEPYFDVIQLLAGNGIIVVEAAGNGSMDLDSYIFNSENDGHYPFTEGNFSNAIIVGAGSSGSSDNPRALCFFTNYGSRIDLQGIGESIVSTGYGDLYNVEGENVFYTSNFGGTSGASPMVVSAIALLQSLYFQNTGQKLNKQSILQLLKQTGKPQNLSNYILPANGNIGKLPNVYAAANLMLSQLKLEAQSATSFEIYPNPTFGKIQCVIPAHNLKSVSITDCLGRELPYLRTTIDDLLTIDLNHFENGSYHLQFEFLNGAVTNKKIELIK